MRSFDPHPRVSVIVPVRDQAATIDVCLHALAAQTYPPERIEILVVDNGSVDDTRGRVRDHPVQLLLERRAGPYAARNAALERASGEILAFIDGDCVADKDWLARGVAELEAQGADLAAGRVAFACGGRPRAAELVDALQHLDHEAMVPRGSATTGNLFVRRQVFAQLGPFVGGRRSGGDVEFTARACGAGHTLVYADGARVVKRARRGWPLLRKKYRVGRGHVAGWRARGHGEREMLPWILKCFRPWRPHTLRARIARRGPEGCEGRFWSLWLWTWAATATQGLGRLREWLLPGPEPEERR